MAKSAIPIPILSENDKNRFFKKISIIPTANRCIEWKAAKSKAGYGVLTINKVQFKAHRVAYFIHHETDPKELLVCHTCDNPTCVNPSHFFLGTNADNATDRTKKGRSSQGDAHWSRLHPERLAKGKAHGSYTKPESVPKGDRHKSKTKPESVPRGKAHHFHLRPETRSPGEKNGKAKLSASDIHAIRVDPRFGYVIAKEYKVTQSVISKIKRKTIWAHIA